MTQTTASNTVYKTTPVCLKEGKTISKVCGAAAGQTACAAAVPMTRAELDAAQTSVSIATEMTRPVVWDTTIYALPIPMRRWQAEQLFQTFLSNRAGIRAKCDP
jgi:hypothetical protein